MVKSLNGTINSKCQTNEHSTTPGDLIALNTDLASVNKQQHVKRFPQQIWVSYCSQHSRLCEFNCNSSKI